MKKITQRRIKAEIQGLQQGRLNVQRPTFNVEL